MEFQSGNSDSQMAHHGASWSQRNFAVCFQDCGALQLAAQRMVDHLAECAALALNQGLAGAKARTGRKA